MSRFQAQTTALLDDELEDLRKRLGLRPNEKAELLRELALVASWVVRQAESGATIESRRGKRVEPFNSPLIERLRQSRADVGARLELNDLEVARLAEILDRGFSPTPGLRKALSRLGGSKRRPPKLRWKRARR